jgi:hypothetical protein
MEGFSLRYIWIRPLALSGFRVTYDVPAIAYHVLEAVEFIEEIKLMNA